MVPEFLEIQLNRSQEATGKYSRTCFKQPLKKKMVFKTSYRLMQVKSNAERAFQLNLSQEATGKYSKPVLSSHSKKLVFKTNYHLMQVKNIAECSKRAFCNTFDLH